MRDFVAAVRGLTVRGRSFLAAGGACIASAIILGEQDLLAVGMLLIAMPLLAAAFVSRTRYRLACTRRLDPRRVTAGEEVSVRIRLDNVSRRPSSVLLVEDQIPYNLGQRARFALGRIEPGGTRDLSYRLRPAVRGRYQVGPLAIRLTDPFGLCEVGRTFRSRDELVVAPTIQKLPPARPVGHASLDMQVRRSTAHSGEDESTTRPYRSGDDLRRVHWKTTARLGELMVRREERPLTSAAAVLLDTRQAAWPAGEGDGDPFSWAVSAACSIAVHLSRGGYGVRLITDAGVVATASGPAVGSLLDELAVVTPTSAASLRPALTSLRTAEHSGMVVAVLGRTDAATAATVAAARPRNAPAIAVLLDLESWGVADPTAGADLQATKVALTRAGWAVLVADTRTHLPSAWSKVFRPAGTGLAGRAGGGSAAGRRRGRRGVDVRPTPPPASPTASYAGGYAEGYSAAGYAKNHSKSHPVDPAYPPAGQADAQSFAGPARPRRTR